MKNQPLLAIKTLLSAIEIHNPTAEICCRIGKLFDVQNKPKQAIFWYKSALVCDKQTEGFVKTDYQDIIPCIELCKLCYQIGEYEKAKEWHEKAKSLRPDHPSVIFNNQFFD